MLILIPKPDSDLAEHLTPAAGILGIPSSHENAPHDYINVFVETNPYFDPRLTSYRRRLEMAATNHSLGIPASVKLSLPIGLFLQAGVFNPYRMVIERIDDTSAIEKWANETIQEVVGIRIDPGDRIEFIESVLFAQSRPLDEACTLFLTRAGQVVRRCEGDDLRYEVRGFEDALDTGMLEQMHPEARDFLIRSSPLRGEPV